MAAATQRARSPDASAIGAATLAHNSVLGAAATVADSSHARVASSSSSHLSIDDCERGPRRISIGSNASWTPDPSLQRSAMSPLPSPLPSSRRTHDFFSDKQPSAAALWASATSPEHARPLTASRDRDSVGSGAGEDEHRARSPGSLLSRLDISGSPSLHRRDESFESPISPSLGGLGSPPSRPVSASGMLTATYHPPSRYPTLLGRHDDKGKRPARVVRPPTPPNAVVVASPTSTPPRTASPTPMRSHHEHALNSDDDEPETAAPGTCLCPLDAEADRRSYRIVRTLGRGAFSRVVLARREGTEETVAVKLLDRRTIGQNPRMRISVVREVEILKHIRHPSLCRLLSSFDTSDYTCLALEHVAGGELFDTVRTHFHDFTAPLVRRVFGELADALGWMHSIGLVHRDIKLENILLTCAPFPSCDLPSPLVKLTDFGLSRFVDLSSPLLETRCGSEEYAAPELLMGKAYDGRATDAWALGVVLFALLCRVLPFASPAASTLATSHGAGSGARRSYLMKIAKADFAWPDAQAAPLATPDARAVVASLLVRDPHKRARIESVWALPWMTGEGTPDRQHRAGEVYVKTDDGAEVDRAVRAEAV